MVSSSVASSEVGSSITLAVSPDSSFGTLTSEMGASCGSRPGMIARCRLARDGSADAGAWEDTAVDDVNPAV